MNQKTKALHMQKSTRKLWALITVIAMVLSSFNIPVKSASVAEAKAEAETETCYISNYTELFAFMERVNNGETSLNGTLTADITINEKVLNDDGTLNDTNSSTYRDWFPIGYCYDRDGNGTTETVEYSGTFDGQGHTISGLYLNNPSQNSVGFFGQASKATIKNIQIEDSYFNGKLFTGAICGNNINSTITQCHSNSTITGERYIGGICGFLQMNSTANGITDCYNDGSVSGSLYVGGLCGYTTSGCVKNSYSIGDVACDNTDNTGKLSGNVPNTTGSAITTVFSNCYYSDTEETDDVDGTTYKTDDDFASGAVTYLLNGSTSAPADGDTLAWGQTLSGDDVEAYPALGGATVYYVNQYKCNRTTKLPSVYSNTNENVYADHTFHNGKCTICGMEMTYPKSDSPVKVTKNSASTGTDLTYGQKLSTLTLNNSGTDKSVFVNVDNEEVDGSVAWTNKDLVPDITATEAEWSFTPANTSIHYPCTGTAVITVSKASPIVAAPVANSVTYASSKPLSTVTLTGNNGTWTVGNATKTVAGTWTWKEPNTILNVGSKDYIAVFTPDDTDHYNSVEKTLTLTVTKATPFADTIPTASDITAGSRLSTSTLSGGVVKFGTDILDGSWAFDNPNTVISSTGAQIVKVTFTPSSGNYNSISINISINVTAAVTATATPSVEATVTPTTSPTSTPSTAAKGKSYTVSKLKYKVTAVTKDGSSGTVTLTGTTKSKASLTTLTVGSTVKIKGGTFKINTINSKAFKGYTKLKSVTIGTNISTLDKEAFSGCTKLKNIYIKSKKLTNIGKNTIKNIYQKAAIKVPSSKLKSYKKLFVSSTGYKKTMTIKK